jgi:CheY-like chemotaxis protein
MSCTARKPAHPPRPASDAKEILMDDTASLRILVVEDNDDDFILLRRSFRLLPFPVETRRADTEAALVDELRTFVPDVVVCDLSLPMLNGISANNTVQRIAPKTPFILFTGAIGQDADEVALRWGLGRAYSKDDVPALLDALVGLAQQSSRRASSDLQ